MNYYMDTKAEYKAAREKAQQLDKEINSLRKQLVAMKQAKIKCPICYIDDALWWQIWQEYHKGEMTTNDDFFYIEQIPIRKLSQIKYDVDQQTIKLASWYINEIRKLNVELEKHA